MARIINLQSLMENILPELAERWGQSDRELGLTFVTDLGACSLAWEREKIMLEEGRGKNATHLSQECLMLLLMGYRTPEDLRAEGRLKGSSRLLPLLNRLFPLQQAHMWWADRF